MTIRAFPACVAALAFAWAGAARAQDFTPVTAPPASDGKAGSEYLQCDGQPALMSGAALAGWAVTMTATLGIVGGLVGAPEEADLNKRVDGDAGVAACAKALAHDTNDLRRAQLTLAKAIHQMEARRYDAAIADAHGLAAAAPTRSAEPGFQRSLGLAALEIEAAALVRLGRPAEAEAVALRMGAAAPYDVFNQVRAAAYVGLTPDLTPAKRAWFDQAVRLWPDFLGREAAVDQWAGRYEPASDRLADLVSVALGYDPDPEPPPLPLITAARAVSLMAAGRQDLSDALADQGRAEVEGMVRDGKAQAQQNTVAQAQELLDFQAIGRQLAQGHAPEARAAFAAHAHWFSPTPPAVAWLGGRLRDGAPAAQLTGSLAVDPARLRADWFANRLKAMAEDKKAVANLWPAVRYRPPNAFNNLPPAVWNTAKSPLIVKRTPKDTYKGEVILITGFQNEAASEAILLHAALLARARGKTGFVMPLTRRQINAAAVRIGDPGDPGFPARATFNAAKVIADLSPEMPDPKR